MTNNSFLDKILSLEYDDFQDRELEILYKYYFVFDLGKSFVKEYESYIKKGDLRIKKRLIEIIKARLPKRFFILNKLENYSIHEDDCEIDFKARFFENLDRMSSAQICYLIDRIGKTSKELRISFFGHRRNEPIAYHAINKVISDDFGLHFAFSFFGRNNNNKYQMIDYKKLNKDAFIGELKKYLKLYFYLLEGMSEVILETKEEELTKKSTPYAITKRIGQYKSIVSLEHKLIKVKTKNEEDSYTMMVDKVEYQDLEEDNEEYDY